MLLSGCGNGNAATDGNEANNNEEAQAVDENFNKEGLPIVNETVTLKVAAKKRNTITSDFEDLEILKQIAEATNVTIDWDVTPEASWAEKKNLMISSGKWPDVFYGNYILENNEIMKLAADDVLMPLEDLIEEYAPNIQKVFDEYPEYEDYITAPDGHIYSLPTINAYQSPAPSAQFINKTWLDEAGMDIPTTTDEFHDTLVAFKEQASDGQVPFTFRYENNIMGINGMFGSFGLVDDAKKLTVVDDRVVYTPLEDEYKEAIKYFHGLFEEGLIDVESFSQDVPVFKSKISSGNTGVCNMWSRSWIFGTDYENSGYVFMPPLEGPSGDSGYLYLPAAALGGKGSFAISTTCENPEIAMRWADYMCDPEISFQLCQGVIGEAYVRNADGMLEAVPDPEGMSHDEFRHSTTPGANSFHMIPASYLEENAIPSEGIAEKQSYDAEYTKRATNMVLPPFYLSPEDATEAAQIQADIGSLVKENTARWLVDGGIEEEWDGFIEQLKKMNVERYVEIYQNRYDGLN